APRDLGPAVLAAAGSDLLALVEDAHAGVGHRRAGAHVDGGGGRELCARRLGAQAEGDVGRSLDEGGHGASDGDAPQALEYPVHSGPFEWMSQNWVEHAASSRSGGPPTRSWPSGSETREGREGWTSAT